MKKKISFCVLLSAILALSLMIYPSSLSAKGKAHKGEEVQPADSPAEDQSVQNPLKYRRYRPSKHLLSEITLIGGNYLGDQWNNTWDIGGNYSLYFNDTWGAGAGYLYSQLYYDKSSTFGRAITDKNVHIGHGEMIINNNCSFRAGKSTIECDLFLTVGGGAIKINNIWKPMGLIGGGLRVFTPLKWFAVRFDVNSYLHPTPNPAGSTFNSDISMNLGLSFLIPVKEKKSEKDTPNPAEQKSN